MWYLQPGVYSSTLHHHQITIVGGGSLSAPTLAVTSANSIPTPYLTVTMSSASVTDNVELQIDTSSSFASTLSATNTVDAGVDRIPNELDVALTTLPDGTYYARARRLNGGLSSNWSNIVNFTIDTYVPPPLINYLRWSNDFLNEHTDGTPAVWNTVGTFNSGSYTGKSTPPTGMNATRWQCPQWGQIFQNFGHIFKGGDIASIYMRSLTGSNYFFTNILGDYYQVTPTWQRFSYVIPEANQYFFFYNDQAVDADIEISSGQVNPPPTVQTYIDTNYDGPIS